MNTLLLSIKYSFVIFFILLGNTLAIQAQGWEKELPLRYYIHSTLLPNEELLILSGFQEDGFPFILTRVDGIGNMISQVELDVADDILLREIHYSKGGLLLVGTQSNPLSLFDNLYLRKTNIDGTLIEWERLFDTTDEDHIEIYRQVKITPVSDGSWIIFDPSQSRPDLQVLRVGEGGNTLWKQAYHADETDSLSLASLNIIEQDNGQFIIAGWGKATTENNYSFLMHLENNGTPIATYYHPLTGMTNQSSFGYATQTADGNFVLLHNNIRDQNNQGPVIKLSPTAAFIWNKPIRISTPYGYDLPTQLLALENGDYIIPSKEMACSNYGNSCTYNYHLKRYSESGDYVWRTSSAAVFFEPYGSGLDAFELSNNSILTVGRGSTRNPDVESQPEKTYLFLINKNGVLQPKELSGNVFVDLNQNCLFDEGEYMLPQQILSLSSIDDNPYKTITQSNGEYLFRVAPSTYTISIDNLNDFFSYACYPNPEDLQVKIDPHKDDQTFDIALTPTANCPLMQVQVGVGEITPCETASYQIQYCNWGTSTAEEAYLTLQLDPYQQIENSAFPYTDLGNKRYQFELGIVTPGTCHFFTVPIALACDINVGLTHCVEAQIYPNDSCVPLSDDWDESSIIVDAICDVEQEEVIFTIENIGTGNMSQTKVYYVYEDHAILDTNTFQLDAGEMLTFKRIANGTTMRLEAAQSDGHPNMDIPIAFVEACGINETGNVSSGIVNTVTDGNLDHFRDISCIQSTASFDPNDKGVTPTGVTAEHHFVNVTDQLNYKIRFQNTGTDTAELVIIRDTISQYLNISTFTSGISSHAYTVHFIDTNVIEFHFDPIELPDSNVNEPASHGFVEFSIYPYPRTALRTRIENSALIYFDNNLPIFTNTTFNTIGERFNTINIVSHSEVWLEDLQINITPQPVNGQAVMHLKGVHDLKDFSLEIFDMLGRKIQVYPNQGSSKIIIDAHNLLPGMYLYRLMKQDILVNSGKLVVE